MGEDIDIKKKLEESEKQKEEYLAGWQRARADLLNFKKEEMDRMAEILKYASEDFILKVLPILDNFEIATRQNLPIEQDLGGQGKNKQIIEGFLQIKSQLQDFLKSNGVEEIKSVGEKFDANWHEVVEPASAEASAGKESGVITEEVQKGYKMNGRLLRPAKVKISK